MCVISSDMFLAMTIAAVRLELTREEARDLRHPENNIFEVHEDCTASTLVSSGLELEEQQ